MNLQHAAALVLVRVVFETGRSGDGACYRPAEMGKCRRIGPSSLEREVQNCGYTFLAGSN
jgi:hypothetical protein